MKLAISTYSLARWRKENDKTYFDCLDWIAQSGVKAVEFVGLDDDAALNDAIQRAGLLRRHCESLGLAVAGYCVGAELLADPGRQQQEIDRLLMHVRIASELRAPNIRHDVTRGPHPPNTFLSFDQVLDQVVPAIQQVADAGSKFNIITSLENHGFYLQTADRIEQTIQAVNRKNFRLTLDLGNFLCLDQDPVQAVGRLAKYAVMVHAKDFYTRPRDKTPVTPGSGWFATPTEIVLRGAIVGRGVIDIPAQLKILNDAGYAGHLSLEFEGIEEPTRAIRSGIDYLTRQLRALNALD